MTNEKPDGIVWDLTSFFPTFNGSEMKKFKETLSADIEKLQSDAASYGSLESDMDLWENLINRMEEISSRLGHIFSYIGCLSACDATNEAFSIEEGSLMQLGAEMSKCGIDVQKAFKDASDETFAKFIALPSLKGATHYLTQTRIQAKFTMSQSEEKLTADLNVNGFHSWGRLYDTISGKLEFDMEYPDGTKKRLPISQCRSLMSHVDREVGKAAFMGGNNAWQGVEDICCAALNAISGTRHTLYKYRGIEHFLNPALFQAALSKKTLDAMMTAIKENAGIAQDIFKAKAKAMGKDGIWWFEREAPLPLKDTSRYTWEEARDMVMSSFRKVYPDFADYYASMLDNNWIESQVRPGKRPGAFCTGSEYTGEQRVYMTFNGSLSEISTITHEVGHAFHSHLLKEQRPIARDYPMTLAETASIFGEHIFAEGVYEDDSVSKEAKLQMLDADLCSAAVMLLDIPIRFEFEKKMYEERLNGDLSVSRLKELMVETQSEIFGDVLLKDGLDPLFWASKLHFYITQVTFYNFPYTFGFLLARQLYNMFKAEGETFLPKYEAFLKYTGSETVENVAKHTLGVDTTSVEFWADAIKSLEPQLKQYRELLSVL